MEKKNMILLTVIAVATLLVAVVGATFAYFTATITDERDGDGDDGQAAITAAETPGSLTIVKSKEGFGSFNEENVYPGHKELIQLAINSDSNNQTNTYFNIVYEGTNTFPNDTIKFTLYESKNNLEEGVTAENAFNCQKESVKNGEEGNYKLYETCTLNPSLKVDTTHPLETITPVNYGDEDGAASKKTILNGKHPFVITGDAQDKTLYYYVVVEYFNNPNADQTSTDKAKSLSGTINVEIAARDNEAIGDDDNHLTNKTNP